MVTSAVTSNDPDCSGLLMVADRAELESVRFLVMVSKEFIRNMPKQNN